MWVLFSDAARVPVARPAARPRPYVRLLAIGLPLTVLAGWVLAALALPRTLGSGLALLVGRRPRAHRRRARHPGGDQSCRARPGPSADHRRERAERRHRHPGGHARASPARRPRRSTCPAREALGAALLDLAAGAVVGGLVGAGRGWLLRVTRRRGWAAEDFVGIAVLALALVAYTGALAVDVNGFVAAFCGGLAFGARRRSRAARGAGLRRADRGPGLAPGVARLRCGRRARSSSSASTR